MAGENPYLTPVEAPMATQKFTVTFLPMEVTIEVDPARLPYGRTGLPGSILDIALEHDIDLSHNCGGVCACSTCHVIIREGLDTVSDGSDDEDDMLDLAPGLTPQSRLACQSVPDGTRDLVVEIPEWNRNAVSEAPHD